MRTSHLISWVRQLRAICWYLLTALSLVIALWCLFWLVVGLVDEGNTFIEGPFRFDKSSQFVIQGYSTDLIIRGQRNFHSEPFPRRFPFPIRNSFAFPGLFTFEKYNIVYCDPNTLAALPTPPEPGLPTTGWRITSPLLIFVLLFSILPVFALIRWLPIWRQRTRQRKGLCLKCGYNLTGNVSGVCPECGEQI